MKYLGVFALLVLVAAAFAADRISGPTVTETFTHAQHMQDPPTILPAVYEICASLGIPKAACITDPKYGSTPIQAYAQSQTDKALWYGGQSSSTDPVSDADCHSAVPIEHYVTWDGAVGTTYVCREPPADDRITAAELAAISRYAAHANSIGKKTLADHRIAMQLKQMASYLATH